MEQRQQIKQLVMSWIRQNSDRSLTDDEIIGVIKWASDAPGGVAEHSEQQIVDVDSILREVKAECAIWVESGLQHLRVPHRDWLPGRRSGINWYYWKSYRTYLEDTGAMAPASLDNMDELTGEILNEMGDPSESGDWDRRGMVVGEVQSGKTANYIGLIDKALDAGYKFIIILAGTQDDLRSQTQQRVDLGVLGVDSCQGGAEMGAANIGVGLRRPLGREHVSVYPMTDAKLDGDFNQKKFTNVVIGGAPLLLVVKKNGHILKRIHRWVLSQTKKQSDAGGGVIHGVPLLLVDDEADSASINTKPLAIGKGESAQEENDPTVINRSIRQILNSFGQRSYVGYTATPFANIFIYPGDDAGDRRKYGDDLFPRHFIFNLPTPSNYVGPSELFGLADSRMSIKHPEGLPLVKYVTDSEAYIPVPHKKDLVVEALPPSLVEAIAAFVLVGAVRRVRGQSSRHNSMLIHVTHYVKVQAEVAALVKAETARLRRTLEFGTGKPYEELLNKLKAMYRSDLQPTARAVADCVAQALPALPSWERVQEELYAAAAKIDVRTVNGEAKDALDYDLYDDTGLSVIVIGGNKLSRGLTLRDLSVSYYLRSTTMYDTLLQMGRWFGYKDGFLDLCRIYTTREIAAFYQWIAGADLELRDEFTAMAEQNATPEEYGLMVRKHPTTLQVTAAGKMRAARETQVSYAGTLVETFSFRKQAEEQEANFHLIESWIAGLPHVDQDKRGGLSWYHVGHDRVTQLLASFVVDPVFNTMNPASMTEYIRSQAEKNELLDWTVFVISVKTSTSKVARIAGYDGIGLPLRTGVEGSDGRTYLLSKNHLISRADEYKDLSKAELDQALTATQIAWEERMAPGEPSKKAPDQPSPPFVRAARPAQRGLLLIYPLDPSVVSGGWDGDLASSTPIVGLAISFPASKTALPIKYMASYRLWAERLGEEEIDDEPDDLV
ncbi:MAG TPA: Z1 domain-containing protein [Clostridia bacterium]|nr:Z1 domain-containing protein [Clostridia bacterium]